MQISSRMSKMPVSAVRKLTPYAVKAKESGAKVYHLNIGDPDIKTPQVMIDALRNWDMNPIRYANARGVEGFLDALTAYYNNLGYDFVKNEHLVVSVGGSEALTMVILSITDPGDEVIVFEPFYSNYSSCAAINGVSLIPVSTDIGNGFHLPTKEEIVSKISDKTKALLICTPNNPTGTVYTEAEMSILVEIAKENNLFIVSDEVYREYNFETETTPSLLDHMQQIPELAIVLDSMSKRYSLCGARLGNTMSLNEEINYSIFKLAQSRLSGGIIDQTIASQMVNVPDDYIGQVNAEYKKRRDLVFEKLQLIDGVEVTLPEGAFYMMVKLPVPNAEEFCIWMLEHFRDDNETLMLAPGEGFYMTAGKGKSEIRLAYVLDVEKLSRALEILELALQEYKSRL